MIVGSEVRRLSREVAELRLGIEILRLADGLGWDSNSRFGFVVEHGNRFGVRRICRVLRINRASFYGWLRAKSARDARRRADDDLAALIVDIHERSRGAYGALRVERELRRQGVMVNRKRVARVMRERGIVGVTRRRRRSLTRPDRSARTVPDLIGRDFTAPVPGIRLVGDITCVRTAEGWLYVASILDLCTREIVGWAAADHMRAALVVEALAMAAEAGLVAENAVFHSDRGSQYGSRLFQAELERRDVRRSWGLDPGCWTRGYAAWGSVVDIRVRAFS